MSDLPLTDDDLIEAGWPADREVLAALRRELVALEEKGIRDRKYALKLLARKVPPPEKALRMRSQPREFAEAIRAETEEDEKNLGAVRRVMREVMSCPVVERGAIMPDACPAGPGQAVIPVGGAVVAHRAILPGAHGMDICCSLLTTFFESDRDPAALLDEVVGATRFGPGGREPGDRVSHPVLDEPVWTNRFLEGLEEHARAHLADQGDGNHFAFLGEVRWGEAEFRALEEAGHGEVVNPLRRNREQGKRTFALVTHHGSRGLGAQVYKRGLKAAIKQTAREAPDIPDAAAWLSMDSAEGEAYWAALQYVARWTRANHECIHDRFLRAAGAHRLSRVGNEHNFVWQRGDRFYHGKGATPAWPDEQGRPRIGLIPLNMASPVLLILGRDREDYLSFAPHGAGRNLSRRALLRRFQGKDGRVDPGELDRSLRDAVRGVDVRWYLGRGDITESPVAYKEPAQVRGQIGTFDLAQVVGEIEPLGSVMAGRRDSEREEELSPKQIRQLQHRSERRRQKQKLRDALWRDEE